MKTELTSLDLEVKRMMLQTPSLFPTRLHCMEFMFCTIGTGYKWQDDGTLKEFGEDLTMPEHIEKAEPYDFRITNGILDEFETIRMEYEDITRSFREKHIDYLCSTYHVIDNEPHFMSVYPMSWEYSPMCIAARNPDKIADDWRDGIQEFIRWFRPKVHGTYGCNGPDDKSKPNSDRISDRRTKENYSMMEKVAKMLKTDEDRENDKELMKLHEKILAKVMSEQDDEG